MSDAGWALPPRAARVYYNAADAWLGDAAFERDPVAALVARLSTDRERRRLARRLRLLEWSPRLLLHARSGFSWLPRDTRRAWLDRLAARGPRACRAAVADLERLVRAGAQSLPDGA